MYISVKFIKLVEDTSATGGNGGSITGGEVYGMGTDITQSRQGPSSTGDLIESPVSTSSKKDTGIYGIPVRKKKKRKIKRFKRIEENNSVGIYHPGSKYGDIIPPNPGMSSDVTLMPINTEPSNDVGEYCTTSEPVDTSVDDKKEEEKKVMNWDSFIRTKMNNITYLN